MEQQNTIENSVASAILEKSIDNIDIEGVTYEIAPPSTATLILISEIVATLPVVKKVPAEEIVTSVLHYARYYRPIGDIAAVLILGAKNLIEYRTIVQEKRYLFGLIRRKTETTIKVDKKAELAKIILENGSPTTLFNVVGSDGLLAFTAFINDSTLTSTHSLFSRKQPYTLSRHTFSISAPE